MKFRGSLFAIALTACGDDSSPPGDGTTMTDASTGATSTMSSTGVDVTGDVTAATEGTAAASTGSDTNASSTTDATSTSTSTSTESESDGSSDSSGSESTGAAIEPFQCDFTAPVEVNDDVSFTALAAEVAIDGQGNATVVFQQTITTNPASAQSRRYDVTRGAWALDAVVLEDAPELAASPHIALAPGGDGIAVWTQNNQLRANRYDAATDTWLGDEAPAVGTPNSSRTYTAMDSEGNAFVGWDEDGPSSVQITLTRFDVDSGTWSPAEPLADTAGDAEVADLAVDGLGNAFVVWEQATGTFAARYDEATGAWSAGQQIIAIPGTAFPIVTADHDGNALVFRSRQIATTYEVIQARYDAGSAAWEPQAVFDNEGGRPAVLALGASGDGFALFAGAGGVDEAVSATRYDPTTGTWDASERIDVEVGFAGDLQIDVNASGHAVAVWSHTQDDGRSVWAACFDASIETWGAAQQISDLDDSWNGANSMDLDDAGNVVVVWGHDVLGSARIQAVRRQ